jgi:cyanophycin synthetase
VSAGPEEGAEREPVGETIRIMKIESITTLAGPNVYLHHPVLVMRLHLEELYEVDSCTVTGFNERLVALLPGLAEHHCGLGYPGGFLERLAGGTYFGHIVEHVAIEMSSMAGISEDFGKTRMTEVPGVYNVIVAYRSERGMQYLLRSAVALVEAILAGRTYDVAPTIAETRRLVARYDLGPSTRAIVEAAERRDIPWTRIGDDSVVQLGHGRHMRRIQAATTDRTSSIAVEISCDKHLTKSLLENASLPVPRGVVALSEEEAIEAFEKIGEPVVIKPLDGCQGKGVSLNVRTADEVRAAFAFAREHRCAVLVEEQVAGRNFRVLVVDGRMIAASERLPAHVVGDGTASIAELVDRANQDPNRGDDHEKPLTKIVIDDIALQHLAKSGLTVSSVPPAGEVVWLREGVNLSTGGTARDVTDRVHPSVRRACERAARVIGLDICGVDLVMDDIAAPLERGSGAIIELNAAPGLRMHAHPSEGEPRDVGGAIVEMLYPNGAPSRVPIVSITGTNGKTTVTRLIAHVIGLTNRCVGMTTTDGIWVGGECIADGDTTGPLSARTVLSDPEVEFAVLETARGGIVRRGLGYDWSDVAVLTNIQPDHFGQDGIESLDDLLYIKQLTAERVRAGGTIVLNADDPTLAGLPSQRRIMRVERRIVYFSLDPKNEVVARHCDAGGTAFILSDGWLDERTGANDERIVRAEDMPMTINGTALHQVANLLAAVAACRASDVSVAQIATALLRFRSVQHNRGRSNLFRLPGGGHVLVDYGHNPEAFRATCAMAERWRGVRVTGIVGVPGDRNNELIAESGRVAAHGFDRIVIVEDRDRRGRRAGEVATLLCQAIKEEVPQRECMIVLDQTAALTQELRRMASDDVIVVFYEDYDPLVELLERCGATVVESLPRQVVHADRRDREMQRADNRRSTPVARSA